MKVMPRALSLPSSGWVVTLLSMMSSFGSWPVTVCQWSAKREDLLVLGGFEQVVGVSATRNGPLPDWTGLVPTHPAPKGKGTNEVCRGDHERTGGLRPDRVLSGRGRTRRLLASHGRPLRRAASGREADRRPGGAATAAGRRVPAEAGGARRPLARSDPGGRGAPETGRDGLHRLRADHPPGRGRLEGRLAGRPSAGAPAVGARAGH